MGWHTFTGTVRKIFAEYLDLEHGGTLEAEPGGVYNIAPAEGHTLPGEDVFYLDCRVLPREDLDGVMARIRSIADGVEREFGVKVGIETVQRASSPPTPADAPIIAALGRAIRAVYAVEPRIVGIGGGTVGAFLRRAGISTAVWSRVDETAHQPDESSRIGNLLGDALVMAALMVGGEAGA